MKLPLLLAGLALALSPATIAAKATNEAGAEEAAHPEARPYDPALDAKAAVDAALASAAERGTLALVVLGANWCHDSRALAGWLATDRFRQLTDEKFEVVYVNVGMPQTGDGYNLDIAARFGLDKMKGTPALFVVDSGGEVRNAETAASWRNAASRSEDEIFDELASLAAGSRED
ncbi:thioredoxin family protein [Parerythrobacter aurantius]|uniref:TlpA family protein disulfide reductase n=1 Tax=Parerythrobacter aurantius TaxID=3127706 RepID=UPI003244DCCF